MLSFFKKITVLGATIGALASSCFAGTILIVNGASVVNGLNEKNTTDAITANLTSLMTAIGNTVTVSDAVPASLSSYTQVWDIRYFAEITSGVGTQYQNYIKAGGEMFVLGENSAYMARNSSILGLISSLGGGTLGYITPNSTQTVLPPFTGPNGPVSGVEFQSPGGFDSKGSGQWITQDGNSAQGTGVAFGTGTLSGAKNGSLTAVFDANFASDLYNLPNSQDLTKNLVAFVSSQQPASVPDSGSTALLAGAALIGLVAFRRSSRSK